MKVCVFKIMANQRVCDKKCPEKLEDCLDYTPREVRLNSKGNIEWDIPEEAKK